MPNYIESDPYLSPRSVLITDAYPEPTGPIAWAITSGPSPGNTCFGRIIPERLEGITFRAFCRARAAGAYYDTLSHFSPMNLRSEMENDVEYQYVPTLTEDQNRLRRGLEIFTEWSRWILSEREKIDPLEKGERGCTFTSLWHVPLLCSAARQLGELYGDVETCSRSRLRI